MNYLPINPSKKVIKPIAYLLSLMLVSCTSLSPPVESPEALYQIYCGSCHLLPEPSNLSKSIWNDRLLPEMAARLGYKYMNYSPFKRITMEEDFYIRMSNTYPEKPLIDSTTWQKIHDYIISQAPDSIPHDTLRQERNAELNQFIPIKLSLDKNQRIAVTGVQFEESTHQFLIGGGYGKYYQWPQSSGETSSFNSPVISQDQHGSGFYITEIGYMNPSEKPLGAVYNLQSGILDTLITGLHRPVSTTITDLNDDGEDEMVICEFGNLTGELSLWVNIDNQFEKRTLLPLPGATKVEVKDMNNDGKKDIVALVSQGKEGIYILYQEESFQFRIEQVIKMGPEYGSSWFELLDYNGDHHFDIVLANGDNADYSNFSKPFHGVRLFINDGNNGFEEKWFYPIYGATRVLSGDYDLDGDWDFVVMAFFPDFSHSPEEGIVFFENKNPNQYQFETFTSPEALSGRWMVMDQGDHDQDGDLDIMVGSFLLPPDKKDKAIIEEWRREMVDVLIFENQAIE